MKAAVYDTAAFFTEAMMMNKRLCFVLFLCFAFLSCFNPTLDETPQATISGGDEYQDDDLYDGSVNHTSFTLDAVSGLPADDAEANDAGKAIATLTVPEAAGPWTPELAAGADGVPLDDNRLFEVAATDGGTFEIRIKSAGGPLPIGPYKVSLNISNEAGKVYHRTVDFNVARTPPPFKEAPSVYPHIIGIGKNKLVVTWNELPPSATWYQLYVGTSANSAEARTYSGRVPMTEALNTAEITDVEWDDADGYLPDGVNYYVWVRPGNSDGEGPLGPHKSRYTSFTMPDFFWLDENGHSFYCWDSFYGSGGPSGDYYIVTPPSEEHPGGQLKYGPGYKDGIVWSQYEIVFFNISEMHGTGKWGEDLSNTHGGCFIVKYPVSYGRGDHGDRVYQLVMFWGMGAIQTKGPEDGVTTGPNKNPKGLILCYFSNAWDLTNRRNPETETFEQAIDKFLDHKFGVRQYNSFVATPWYRDYTTDRSVWPWY
jgi:hypothetical protein